ncbi:MAG: caspase family protein [Ilumatobacteraceae bacterium]
MSRDALSVERAVAPAPAVAVNDTVTPAHHFAIVIGIDRYPGLTDLSGACNDATSFHDWLVDPHGGGLPSRNTRLHLGRDAADARSATPKKWEIDADPDELIDAVRASGPLPTRTRLYLFFAGHGIVASTGTGAWLMADAKLNLFNNLALTPYRAWLERCRDFDEVVMLSDCCRSIKAEVQDTPQPHTCDEPESREQRVFLAHAANIGGRAFEDSTADDLVVQGHFTRALLEGLRGQAADATGAVLGGSLADHLRQRLTELSADTQLADVDAEDRMVMAVNARSRRAVRIQLAQGAARSVRLLGATSVVAAEVRGGGSWELQLIDGDYQLLDDRSDRIVRFTVAGADVEVEG